MVVELRVVLHDRHEASGLGGPQIQFCGRHLAGKSREVPAPVRHAAEAGRDSGCDGCSERLPAGVLIAGPCAPVALGPGVAGTAERHRSLALLDEQVVVGAGVLDWEAVVRLGATTAVVITQVGAPRVLATVR